MSGYAPKASRWHVEQLMETVRLLDKSVRLDAVVPQSPVAESKIEQTQSTYGPRKDAPTIMYG